MIATYSHPILFLFRSSCVLSVSCLFGFIHSGCFEYKLIHTTCYLSSVFFHIPLCCHSLIISLWSNNIVSYVHTSFYLANNYLIDVCTTSIWHILYNIMNIHKDLVEVRQRKLCFRCDVYDLIHWESQFTSPITISKLFTSQDLSYHYVLLSVIYHSHEISLSATFPAAGELRYWCQLEWNLS